jgi:hypothetical protein
MCNTQHLFQDLWLPVDAQRRSPLLGVDDSVRFEQTPDLTTNKNAYQQSVALAYRAQERGKGRTLDIVVEFCKGHPALPKASGPTDLGTA